MSKKMKLIPELRFPEFLNDGEWAEKKLEDLASFSKGKGISKSDIAENGRVPCIRYGELYTHYNETISFVHSYTNLDPKDLVLNEANDVIIPASGETQIDIATASCVLEDGIALGGDLNIIKTNINGVFLSYYLNNAKKMDIARIAQGISVVHLYAHQLKKLVINFPKPQEQQKIASCLSSLDKLIAAHSDKLETLKDHKKGLMQNLFPQKGQKKVPNYRFPEFEKDGEWVEKELGEICKFTGGGTPSKNKDSYWTGKYPWISSSDITEDSIHQIKVSRFITEQAIKESATKIVPANSILLVSRVGVGKLAFTTEPICTSQDFTNLTPNNDNLVFLAYYLKSHKEDLLVFNQGMAIKGFTKKDVESLKIFLPDNKKEQQKIAFCLSALDELITAQSEKIEQLQQHKKGLMQGLFPRVK